MSKVVRSLGELFSLPTELNEADVERIEAIVALDRKLGRLIEPSLEPATVFELRS